LPDTLQAPGRAVASLRWLVFGVLVSAALFRERALVASMGARRRSARGLVAISLLLLIALAFVAVNQRGGAAGPALRWTEAVILLVAIGMSAGFGRLVDRAAARVYGVPIQGDVAAAHDVYRRAVAEAQEEGRALGSDPMLERLRDELGIAPATARALERLPSGGGALRPGLLLAGRYRIERYLGRGGGGRAFVARDELLRRTVVVKEALPSRPDDALREARAASAVQHPGIVALHDALARDEQLLLVMEYVDGGTLAERVASTGRLAGAEGERVALELLDAVAALHAAGLVHGDLKPQNVLLTAGGRPKVGDFGLARVGETTSLAPDPARGTPGYAAPEILAGAAPDARADVHALGVLLARCFDVPALDAVAEAARAERPEARWADASHMRDAARAALAPVHEEAAPDADDVAMR
ncbi:MAG TPA: serine/threonine-protein kinase, partial [Candidatus Thermoplasmatota archaeon]|nr:serine/threonine-protein kinase [Candidatus Thermoplasmatota archaeon]